MQSDLIFKADELLDPADYPESQRELIGDLNKKLGLIMGIITGLGKEYHTIQECADDYGISKQGMHKKLRKLNII